MSGNENIEISLWRGECRHPDGYVKAVNSHYCPDCHTSFNDKQLGQLYYDSDPSAWDDNIYKEIEEKGLVKSFELGIYFSLWAKGEKCDINNPEHSTLYRAIKATPPQKASALAMAIKEAS